MKNLNKIENFCSRNNFLYNKEVVDGLNSILYKNTDKIFYEKIEFFKFITIAECPEIITKQTIQNFSNLCFDNARRNYDGRGLGNNSGIVSIALLICDKVDESAKEFCKKKSKPHWASIQIHIIYDLENNLFYNYSGWRAWGGFFNSYYRKISNETMNLVKSALSS